MATDYLILASSLHKFGREDSDRKSKAMYSTSISTSLLKGSKADLVVTHVEGGVYILQEHIPDHPERQGRRSNYRTDTSIGRLGSDLAQVEERSRNSEGLAAEAEADRWDGVAWDSEVAGGEGLARVLGTGDRGIEVADVVHVADDEGCAGVNDGLDVLDSSLLATGRHALKEDLRMPLR